MSIQLDVLAFAAHPDDVELAAGGTIAKMVKQGKRVGIIDLTRGQLGSRGTPDDRDSEAASSAGILGIAVRENLGMQDGFFQNDRSHQELIIQKIRQYRPDVVLANAPEDRHPDHGRAATLVSEAAFYSGLRKIDTQLNGESQSHWRPRVVYHYIQDWYLKPDIVVDISDEFETRVRAIKAFKTQFYDPNSKEPQTPISSREFIDFLEGRAREFGRTIGVEFGEGFIAQRTPGVKDLCQLL
jgi:bacillithiol biosynthesis deacetylase BshB1